MMFTLKVLSLGLALAATEIVTLRVFPPTVTQGQYLRVTCRVAPNVENRKLQLGLDFWRSSEVQLDGERAKITHELLIGEIPCNPGLAFCRVTRTRGRDVHVTAHVPVAGCD